MKTMQILIIKVVMLISILSLTTNKIISQKTYTVGQKTVVEKSTNIILEDLKKQGLKRISELVKLAKQGKAKELSAQFASRQLIKNPDSPDDKIEYAIPETETDDEELLNERVDFFNELEKNCGKKKKVSVGYIPSDDEPIGFAFRITIPGKMLKGDVACNHYVVGFRRSLDNKLLVTEWYPNVGQMDCQ